MQEKELDKCLFVSRSNLRMFAIASELSAFYTDNFLTDFFSHYYVGGNRKLHSADSAIALQATHSYH